MAVKLRLRRMGKKRQPIYKVVAADVRSPRDGKFIEAIGLYNPKTDPAEINIQEERALYWLGVGAIPTETVRNILKRSGILLKRELLKDGLDEEKINARMEEFFAAHNKKLEKTLEKKPAVKEEKTEEISESAPEAQETVSEESKAEETEEKTEN
ncbi:MAG: 30S ribosomal protein S16 [Chlorobi bacterium]|nr:30S ribosomal protein S16 [Chlorobiota bacterium]